MRRVSSEMTSEEIRIKNWSVVSTKVIFEGLLFACAFGIVVYFILRALGA